MLSQHLLESATDRRRSDDNTCRQFKLSTAESRESLRTLGSRQDLTQVASSLCISKMGMVEMDMEFVCALKIIDDVGEEVSLRNI